MFSTYLPTPLLDKIVAHWNQKSLANASIVCKQWNQICLNHWHTIDRSRSKLSDPFKTISLQKLPHIKNLDLTACASLSPQALTEVLAHCGSNLEQLTLRRCPQLGDSVLKDIAKYNHFIKSISFAGMKLITDDGIIAMMEKLKYVERIGLGDCVQLTDNAVAAICSSSHIRFGAIGLNSVSKLTDISLGHIQQLCPNITILSLSSLTSLTSKAMQSLVSCCHKLGSIDLTKCSQMDNDALFAIAQHCPILFQLNVSHTLVTDEGVIAVANGCPKLRLAFLTGCKITNAAIESLAHCKLQVLILNKCGEVTSEIFEYLNTQPPMPFTHLDILGTKIRKSEIPTWVDPKVVTSFDRLE